jgi:hypothetical protein
MKRIFSLVFILILLGVSMQSFAQSSGLEVREANINKKIATSDILGDWYLKDSLKSKISFIKNRDYFVFIEGIKPGIGNYGFTQNEDSIFVNGTAANWPPYDCTLNLINKNSLEIKFYQYFTKETYNLFFKRK